MAQCQQLSMEEEEIMAEFAVDVRTLYNWRKKQLIPFGTMGGKIYYDRRRIEASLRKKQTRPS